jgi:hypothetical protein
MLLDVWEEVGLDDEDEIRDIVEDADTVPLLLVEELDDLLELTKLLLEEDVDAADDEEVLVGIMQEILAPIPTNTSLGSLHITQLGEPPTPQPPY